MASDPSADNDLLQGLSRAAAFIQAVREAQQESGKKLSGQNYLDDSILKSIGAARDSSALVATLKQSEIISEKEANTAFERFEEICRRQHVLIEASLRPFIIKMLAAELAANSIVLGLKPEKALPVTIYQGNITSLLKEEEFAPFADTPSIIKYAVVGNPSDPREFLRKVIADIKAISGEEEFAPFADTPSIITRAVVGYPSDPRRFLRKVIADIKAISGEEEFAQFADTPGIIKYAVVGYPSDPREFLSKVSKEIQAITAEKEFAQFADTPGIIKYAVVHYPSDPREFLSKVSKEIQAITAEKEFAQFADTPGIIKTAVVSYPSDPRKFLRQLKESLDSLSGQAGFRQLNRTQQIRRAMKEMGLPETEVSAFDQLSKMASASSSQTR